MFLSVEQIKQAAGGGTMQDRSAELLVDLDGNSLIGSDAWVDLAL